MISPAILRALAAAGATTEMIIAAVEAAEREDFLKEETRLEGQRERTRRYRANKEVSRDVTLHSVTSYDERDVTDAVSLETRSSPTPPKETQSLSKENPPKGGQKKGSRLPSDWQPSEANLDDALRIGVPRDRIPIEADKFRDWAHSVAGQKGVKNSWDAAWRNWCRNATGPPNSPQNPLFGQQRNGHDRRQSGSEQMLAEIARRRAERDGAPAGDSFAGTTIDASYERRSRG